MVRQSWQLTDYHQIVKHFQGQAALGRQLRNERVHAQAQRSEERLIESAIHQCAKFSMFRDLEGAYHQVVRRLQGQGGLDSVLEKERVWGWIDMTEQPDV